jgi:hypothetical protein
MIHSRKKTWNDKTRIKFFIGWIDNPDSIALFEMSALMIIWRMVKMN